MPIVFTEKDIEDYIENELHTFVHRNAVSVARQLTLPSGKRIDLASVHRETMGRGRFTITIVEIKAQQSRTGDLVQLVEYVDEVRKGMCDNTEVHGLLLAPTHSDHVHRLISPMEGFTTARFCVQIAPTFRQKPAAKRMWSSMYVPPSPTEAHQTVVSHMLQEYLPQERDEISVAEHFKRRRALVPISQAPQRFARLARNGNGARP